MTAYPVRTHRRVSVLVTELAIADGEVAPPEVGDIGCYALLFTETPPDATDPSIVTVEVDVEPLDDGVPLRQPAPSPYFSEEDRWWEWRLFLRGDGWTATWYSRRPTVGRQRLTGRVIGDLGFATTGSVTGRILRAQIVSDTYRLLDHPSTAPPRPLRWIPVPGTRRFRDVATATGVFRDDTRPPAHLSPGMDRIRESGVLVDLDLDDVPPPPIRPALVPAAASAHGRDIWIVDRELPVVIRLREQRIVGESRFPGAILTALAHRPRWVHADAEGCWVVGRDGIFRCDLDGAAERIDEHRVAGSAAHDGVLLSWYRTDGQSVMSMRRPDRRHQEFDPLDGRIRAVHSGRDGFMGAVHTGNGEGIDLGPVMRDQVAATYGESEVLRAMAISIARSRQLGIDTEPAERARKILLERHGKSLGFLAGDLTSAGGGIVPDSDSGAEAFWHNAFLSAASITIGAGTPEIQLEELGDLLLRTP